MNGLISEKSRKSPQLDRRQAVGHHQGKSRCGPEYSGQLLWNHLDLALIKSYKIYSWVLVQCQHQPISSTFFVGGWESVILRHPQIHECAEDRYCRGPYPRSSCERRQTLGKREVGKEI